MYRTVVALLLLLLSSLILTVKEDDYFTKHEFAKVEYYNKNILEYMKVKNVKPNRTYRAYSISGHTLMDLEGDTLKGNAKAFRFARNLFNHKIFDFDVKICDALRMNHLGIAELLKTSNLSSCPIRKGYYAVNNFNVDDHELPPFIPAGRYKLQLTLLHGEYTVAWGSLYVEVIYKTNK